MVVPGLLFADDKGTRGSLQCMVRLCHMSGVLRSVQRIMGYALKEENNYSNIHFAIGDMQGDSNGG